jgi:diguanylate cyclase (GGDEF)-like protein/PAS domain S-box-containing protein
MAIPPVRASDEVQRLQDELQAAQRRLQALADASGSLVGKLEFELRTGDGLVFVSADEVAHQIHGQSLAPLYEMPVLVAFPALRFTDLPTALHDVAVNDTVLGPGSLLGERYLSGSAFNFFAFRLRPGRVVVKFWDSSGALEAQKMAKLSQQQLAVVFSQSPVAISLSRERDGVYVDVNDAWSRLTGLSLRQVTGKSSIDCGFWTDVSHRDAVLNSAREKGRLLDFDLPYTHPDGRSMMLQLNVAHIDIGGTPYFLSYLKDVTADREAQSALLANRQLLRVTNQRIQHQIRLFEAMEDLALVGYWTSGVDPSSLRWSNGMYRLSGFEPGSVMDRATGRSGIHPEDHVKFQEARARVDGSVVEFRWLHPDGRVRWLRSRIQHLSGEGEDAADFGVVQDVTAERQATLALQERLGFIQKMTASLPGLVFQLRKRADGVYEFVYVSETVRTLYRGVTPAEVMQYPLRTLKLHHPDDLQGFIDSIQVSARDITPWSHEYRLRFEDGEVRWLQGQALPEREADGSVLWNGFTTNITQRKVAEEKLRESEARFRSLTALSSDWYWEHDADMRFVRMEGRLMNPQFGASVKSRFGKTRWELGALNMTAQDWADHRALLDARQAFHDLELQDVDDHGNLYWMSLSGEPIFDARGVFTGYRGVGRNITGRKRAEQEIERLAFFDVLTALPNRRLLMDRLQQALTASGRDRSSGALLFIDLDNFKDLNDTQGHETGDQLLKQVAVRLTECVREVDTVARLGGDEFVVMLERLSAEPVEAAAQAEGVGRKILMALNQPYSLAGLQHHSTPSIGITRFHDQQMGMDELLKQADVAMYQAKAAGRNTLRFYDPAMQAVVAARASMESDLRQGLRKNEMVLYYQPVVNELRVVVGAEALVRWHHPQRGLVMPGEFIPLAEQTGLIIPLGEWVLEVACAQLVNWAAQPRTAGLSLAVNVSVRQFRQAEFVSQLMAMLRRTGANPARLKLEITESLLVSDMEDAIEKMRQLQAFGVTFSLDDFGTGYSSLAYLKRLSLEQLKIDRSFVADVPSSASDAAIVQTVLTLGKSLGLTVVAEGVETQAQCDFLLRQDCRLFQGYLFGRPVPLEQLALN